MCPAGYRGGETMPVELSDSNFEDFLREHSNVVVDFWAPWCGPCRIMSPVIEALEKDMDNVVFAKVNVDESQEIAQAYSIMSIPTLMFFKDGEMEDMAVGVMDKGELREKINEVF